MANCETVYIGKRTKGGMGVISLKRGLRENIEAAINSVNGWALSFLVMLFSWMSDHTVSKLGRRKPYLFLSAPFVIATTVIFPFVDEPALLRQALLLLEDFQAHLQARPHPCGGLPGRLSGGSPRTIVLVPGSLHHALGKPARAISCRAIWTQRAARCGSSFRVCTSFIAISTLQWRGKVISSVRRMSARMASSLKRSVLIMAGFGLRE